MWQTGGPPVLHRIIILKLLTQHVRRLLGTHQWQSALVVVGLPVTEDWFEMGCHLFPSLISIRLTARTWIAVHAVPPSQRRGGVNTNKQTSLRPQRCWQPLETMQQNQFYKSICLFNFIYLRTKHCLVFYKKPIATPPFLRNGAWAIHGPHNPKLQRLWKQQISKLTLIFLNKLG